MDLARRVGCNQVSPWFGHDGFDYILQADYVRAWDLLVEGLTECADHDHGVKVAVEFKVKEPRTHAFVGSTAKALLLAQEVNRPNVGSTWTSGMPCSDTNPWRNRSPCSHGSATGSSTCTSTTTTGRGTTT